MEICGNNFRKWNGRDRLRVIGFVSISGEATALLSTVWVSSKQVTELSRPTTAHKRKSTGSLIIYNVYSLLC